MKTCATICLTTYLHPLQSRTTNTQHPKVHGLDQLSRIHAEQQEFKRKAFTQICRQVLQTILWPPLPRSNHSALLHVNTLSRDDQLHTTTSQHGNLFTTPSATRKVATLSLYRAPPYLSKDRLRPSCRLSGPHHCAPTCRESTTLVCHPLQLVYLQTCLRPCPNTSAHLEEIHTASSTQDL